MKDRELKKYLKQSFGQGAITDKTGVRNAKLDETIELCTRIMREQKRVRV